jgi:hypothetical protein
LAWDSTSLSVLKECPYKYYLKMIEGWSPKRMAVPLFFGILLHEATENYDKQRSAGATHDEAVESSVRLCLEKSGEHLTAVVCKCGHDIGAYSDGEMPEAADCPECGIQLMPLMDYAVGSVWEPWDSGQPDRNRANLIRTVVWYYEEYKNDPAKTVILASGKPAVELSFRFELDKTSAAGEQYLACGHLDRVVEFNSGTYVMDHKTSKNQLSGKFFQQFNPDNQMSMYSLGGQVTMEIPINGVIINGIQVQVNQTKFQRGLANRTPNQIGEWLEDFQLWIDTAERYAKALHWPMNDKSCHHYAGCEFREVCSKSANTRSMHLKAGFQKRVWDPLVVR